MEGEMARGRDGDDLGDDVAEIRFAVIMRNEPSLHHSTGKKTKS
jgi:hypothetical protein